MGWVGRERVIKLVPKDENVYSGFTEQISYFFKSIPNLHSSNPRHIHNDYIIICVCYINAILNVGAQINMIVLV